MGQSAHDLRQLSPKSARRLLHASNPVADGGQTPDSEPYRNFSQTRATVATGTIHQQLPTPLDLRIPTRCLQVLGRNSQHFADSPDHLPHPIGTHRRLWLPLRRWTSEWGPAGIRWDMGVGGQRDRAENPLAKKRAMRHTQFSVAL